MPLAEEMVFPEEVQANVIDTIGGLLLDQV